MYCGLDRADELGKELIELCLSNKHGVEIMEFLPIVMLKALQEHYVTEPLLDAILENVRREYNKCPPRV